MTHDDYFTAGEMAAIFGISKQTLLYYDHINLLKPDFVADNGYRYYSIRQYLDLEIIVTLRQLDMAIPDIRRYMDHRGRDSMEKMLDKKYRGCEDLIRQCKNLEYAIGRVKRAMDKKEQQIPGNVMISWQPEMYLYLDMLAEGMGGKERIIRYAKASQGDDDRQMALERQLGWVMDADSYLHQGNVVESKAFFVIYPKEEKYENIVNHKIPAGLCCHVIFEGTFYSRGTEIKDSILTFLQQCRMKPREDIYVLPVKNHWYTTDWTQYVTEIFFPVVTDEGEKENREIIPD
ncbi:MerR family transcriptional regulator [uncultured Dialister sp.]|uniref:MerR family transcriptional regulator n=1 Tax=uncultured Dialister sp. TaxID=278064 RepID=UPI0027DB2981|nr:MerR family transcriptional regulator [uncultured Dialister sp.]